MHQVAAKAVAPSSIRSHANCLNGGKVWDTRGHSMLCLKYSAQCDLSSSTAVLCHKSKGALPLEILWLLKIILG